VIADNVSIVIPTLGGKQLESTIESLNSGSLVPGRILVCIPEQSPIEASVTRHVNVEILWTGVRGQVAQRAVGLAMADTEFIVQLDDDILLEQDCLAQLVAAAKRLGDNSAVSPAFVKPGTGESLYRVDSASLFKKCYFRLLNGKQGFQPGTITRAGTTLGIECLDGDVRDIESEWLPGGCVLHYKANAITDNYFPFTGKAFSEDLYFSLLAASKGIKLYICTGSRCVVDPMPEIGKQGAAEFFRVISGDLRARAKFVKDTGRCLPRMYIFYLLHILKYFTCKLLNLRMRKHPCASR
jgi:glycosyltransferase involved in cell wall biosynthesis